MFSDMLDYVRMMAEIRNAANKKKERLRAAEEPAPAPAVADPPKPSPKAAAPEAAKPAGHRYSARTRTRMCRDAARSGIHLAS